MSETDNSVLHQLRVMDSKLDDIRERIGRLETRMAAWEQHLERITPASELPRTAADVFRPIWAEGGIELSEPADTKPPPTHPQ